MSRPAAKLERPQPMTLEEWAELDDEIEGELVDGLLEEEEMPSFLHEMVVSWLIVTLHAWARRRGGRVAASEAKIAVGPRRGRKPDVSVYMRSQMPAAADRLITVAPYLVAEVTSPRPRDTRRDRIDKLRDYARAGIRYYWILDPQLRSLEVFELGRGRSLRGRAHGGGRPYTRPGLFGSGGRSRRTVARRRRGDVRARPALS